MQNQELTGAYCATNYQLTILNQQYTVRIGVPAEVLEAPLAEAGFLRWAFITAWNPGSVRYERTDNARRNGLLFQALRGMIFAPAIAIPDAQTWPREPGFVVFDQPEATLRALGERFEQNALVLGEGAKAPQLLWLQDD